MLFAGREVRTDKKKTVPSVLSTVRGRSSGTVFPYTDQPRPVNNIFIYLRWTRRIGSPTVYARYAALSLSG